MEPIQFVDLRRQTARIRKELDASIARVIDSGAFIQGPDVASFEKELAAFTGATHVISCANGTDALQIALMAIGLEPGDEVITPDFTYFATAEVIALLRLTPVLVDVDPGTFTVDPAEVERAITPRTKVILPVHLYGQCADMAPLLDIAARNGLSVVEDAAQAIGAVYTFPDGTRKQAGTMGTFGTTSFFPSKNLGCFGDGGAIFSNDEAIARCARAIANHGQSKKYIHDLIGVNSRLDTLQAAILRVKLRHLPSFADARVTLANAYDRAFIDLPVCEIPTRAGYSSHVFHQYTVKLGVSSRDAVATHLKGLGVPTSIYYPMPLHSQKAFEAFDTSDRDCPAANQLSRSVLSLPMHSEMDDEQQAHIIDAVRKAISAVG